MLSLCSSWAIIGVLSPQSCLPVEHTRTKETVWWRRWKRTGKRRTPEGREKDVVDQGQHGVCYNAGKLRTFSDLLQSWQEYDQSTNQQSNEQRGGPIEERGCPGSAPERVHLWRFSA